MVYHSNLELSVTVINDKSREVSLFADDRLDGGALHLANFIVDNDDHVSLDAIVVFMLSLQLANQLLRMLDVADLGPLVFHQRPMLLRRVSTENISSDLLLCLHPQ